DIINDLDDMIKNKDTSALYNQSYAKFLDSSYGFQPQALDILHSKIANLKLFTAPFSDKAEKRIYYGTIINMVIEDIPQFIIQIHIEGFV
ncbi:10414_t:CDS:2, partial [Cetraspora pellucida]